MFFERHNDPYVREVTTSVQKPRRDAMTIEQEVADGTGIDCKTVAKIPEAQVAFLSALGLVHPDDEGRGAELRRKHPDLLRDSAAGRVGRSPGRPISYELEATIVQMEGGASARELVDAIGAQ